MQNSYKSMSHDEFVQHIEKICCGLSKYITDNQIKVDYICPILRSGAIPAVYIANKLNIVKFLPIQVKHVAYKNGDNKIELLFNPMSLIEIQKREPVFLIVDALQSTGTSVEICINQIKNKYKDAKILYVCLAKEYGCRNSKEIIAYEDFAFYYNGNNKFSEEKCEELNVEYYHPLFPWEELEMELEHPDDLEDNIFF